MGQASLDVLGIQLVYQHKDLVRLALYSTGFDLLWPSTAGEKSESPPRLRSRQSRDDNQSRRVPAARREAAIKRRKASNLLLGVSARSLQGPSSCLRTRVELAALCNTLDGLLSLFNHIAHVGHRRHALGAAHRCREIDRAVPATRPKRASKIVIGHRGKT